MKLFIFFTIVACLQVSAKGYSQQKITLSEKNAPLEKIFKEIKKQTGYDFMLIYNPQMLKDAQKVTINVQDADLKAALDLCFANQPLIYTIVNKTIVVQKKEQPKKIPFSLESEKISLGFFLSLYVS